MHTVNQKKSFGEFMSREGRIRRQDKAERWLQYPLPQPTPKESSGTPLLRQGPSEPQKPRKAEGASSMACPIFLL